MPSARQHAAGRAAGRRHRARRRRARGRAPRAACRCRLQPARRRPSGSSASRQTSSPAGREERESRRAASVARPRARPRPRPASASPRSPEPLPAPSREPTTRMRRSSSSRLYFASAFVAVGADRRVERLRPPARSHHVRRRSSSRVAARMPSRLPALDACAGVPRRDHVRERELGHRPQLRAAAPVVEALRRGRLATTNARSAAAEREIVARAPSELGRRDRPGSHVLASSRRRRPAARSAHRRARSLVPGADVVSEASASSTERDRSGGEQRRAHDAHARLQRSGSVTRSECRRAPSATSDRRHDEQRVGAARRSTARCSRRERRLRERALPRARGAG